MPTEAKKKNASASRIPEAVQSPIRAQLKSLRLVGGLKHRTQVQCISPHTLTTYELHDISTMKLGDLWGLAAELGIPWTEFTALLLESTDETTEESDKFQQISTVVSQLKNMSEAEIETVASLTRHLGRLRNGD